ncbi:MAG TPA: hypothetical protein VGR00_04640 [Thermoanaerobaculia bacterium]|nr:hypothetical protein [Thermoanaerobaculia bacterium]
MNQFLLDALPYLLAFYLLDGFFLVPSGGALFASSNGRRFRLARGRLAFVFPSPWAEAYVVAEAPSLPKAFDASAVRARCDAARKGGRRLTALGAALTATLFGLLPLRLLTKLADPVSPLYVLAVAVLLQAATLIEVRRRAVACGMETKERRILLASLLLPSAAAHARLLSGKDLFTGVDSLTLAAVLLPRSEFRVLARREWTRLDVASETAPGSPANTAARLRAGFLQALLSAEGFTLEDVLAPPPPSDPTAVLYCPLCDAEYTAQRDACADCGTRLRKF